MNKTTDAVQTIDSELRMWKCMYRIRAIEERIATKYSEWKMRCPTHLSIGQEGVPAALAENITLTDYAVSTHRGHAHYLAKGGSLNAMIAEIYGKASGCCGGRGGSMHLIDKSVGFMGTSAIVGNSIPLGVGLALASQIKSSNQISCIFLGDGAVEEGAFYESINFSVIRNLPALFICENNLYSVYTPLPKRQPKNRKIFEMVEGLGIQVSHGDGNNVIEAKNIISNAVQSIRNGRGPYFLEFDTYRHREHCGPEFDDQLNYRHKDEVMEWKSRDPILSIEAILTCKGADVASAMHEYGKQVQIEIDHAFAEAESSPFPDLETIGLGVYAD